MSTATTVVYELETFKKVLVRAEEFSLRLQEHEEQTHVFH